MSGFSTKVTFWRKEQNYTYHLFQFSEYGTERTECEGSWEILDANFPFASKLFSLQVYHEER
jgi:hypothetical protein